MTGDQGIVRIGTRGSALALWQTNHVADRIRGLSGAPRIETVRIRTEGDRVLDTPLSAIEGKSFFTKEIEEALLDGRIDVAVHSFKDLATVMPEGLAIGAVLEREDPRDVLLATRGGDLASLPDGAGLGTSSLRRRALIARRRPDVRLVELRGNVPTRIAKLDAGDYDAIVLAAAGVKRLGLEDRVSAYLSESEVMPAVAQGAVAVQIRAADTAVGHWIRPLDHRATRAAVAAERALLGELEGGCQVPVGALATFDEGALSLSAVVCSLDGTQLVDGNRRGHASEAEAIGKGLAGDLLARGAERILAQIRAAGGGSR
jgi:hydroxymethylbilane synthase